MREFNPQLMESLREITEEEKNFLEGKNEIDRGVYVSSDSVNPDVFEAKKLLEAGKLISIRKHTRFVHFPKHTHNYVEVMYMCSGSTRHIINGDQVTLEAGELLFLNQRATQEIFPAGENDIGVNFIILPAFFDYALTMQEDEENLLRTFILDGLTGKGDSSYLHFKVADLLPVQNLVENLIWTLMNHQPNKRSTYQATMGLLIIQLMNNIDRVETDSLSENEKFIMSVLSYIDEHYRDGELSELAENLHYDFYWLSREIKKRTGQTYTELVQIKRLSQAAYLLSHTAMAVSDVAIAVGYENISYFHKLFRKNYNMSPKKYRDYMSIGVPRDI